VLQRLGFKAGERTAVTEERGRIVLTLETRSNAAVSRVAQEEIDSRQREVSGC